MSLRTSVVLRAANQNLNDCRWQSYRNLSMSLVWQSPGSSENHERPHPPSGHLPLSGEGLRRGLPHQSEDWFAMTI